MVAIGLVRSSSLSIGAALARYWPVTLSWSSLSTKASVLTEFLANVLVPLGRCYLAMPSV